MREQELPPIPSKQAEKYLNKLDSKTRARVIAGIEKIPAGDIKLYKTNPEYSRLRIGDYRILFKWLSDNQIFVLLVERRGQVYKKGL